MVKRSGTYLLVTGVLGIIFGILMMAKPGATALALVLVWGIYALVDGVYAFIAAFQSGVEGGQRAFLIFVGLIGVAAGLVAIFQPLSSGIALTIVLGVWLIVRGLTEMFGGAPGGSRWLSILAGVLWVVAGFLVINRPGIGLLSVAIWVGSLAVVWGVIGVYLGITMRRESKETAESAAAA